MARSETAKTLATTGAMTISCAYFFGHYVLWFMMIYLTDVWKISFTSAAAIINLWTGASEMLPVLLAHIADAFVGNFTVLLISALSYCAGLGLLTMSTPPMLASHFGTCSEYKPECIGDEQKRLFYIGLGLISVGVAGQLSSHTAFALAQLDENRGRNTESRSYSRFQCWAMFLGIFGVFLLPVVGIWVIPYIKPWSIRFGIAAIFSVVCFVIFLLGCFWYTYVGPQGSPLTTIIRVFVASTTKLFCKRPENADQLHKRNDLDHEPLPHTKSFCCLDKAAIVLQSKPLEQQETNRWRLCTVTEVEGTKIFLRMIPICLTFVTCGLVSSVGNTYFVEQANHMNHKLGRLRVPLPILLAFYDVSKSHYAKKFYSAFGGGENPSWYAPTLGIAASMVFAILCCASAAIVEDKRLVLIDKPNPKIWVNIFWLLPQFVLLGLLDGMYKNSVIWFLNDQQSGPSMRRPMIFRSRPSMWAMWRYMILFSGVFWGSGVAGNSVLVYVVGKVSERGGKRNWFQRTINESRLDKYFWVLMALSAVNLVVFVFVVWFFKYREPRSEGMAAHGYNETDGDQIQNETDGNQIQNETDGDQIQDNAQWWSFDEPNV